MFQWRATRTKLVFVLFCVVIFLCGLEALRGLCHYNNIRIFLYCTVLYCIVLYCIVLYFILLYCIVLYFIVLYFIVLYFIVLYCILLYCNVLSCIVMYPTSRSFVNPLAVVTSL